MGDTPHGFLFGKSFEPGKSALGTRLGLAGFENIGSKSGICIFIFFNGNYTNITKIENETKKNHNYNTYALNFFLCSQRAEV